MPESSPLRPARRPHSAAPAAIAVAVLVLTGCTAPEEEHPLASPTSDTAVPAAEPTPAYTTELQLSEEEKTAVDEALTVLQEFVETTNNVYSAGGDGFEKFEKVARDAVLFKSENESKEFASSGSNMTGTFRLDQLEVIEVDLEKDDDTQIPFTSFLACVPTDEYGFDSDSASEISPHGEGTDFVTFQFVVAEYEQKWYVSEQNLWSESCEIG